MNAPPLPAAPYPGLRAFRPEEARIFCGRAQHRAELLDRLGEARFLAVVGASGSGKSSLVLAGLLPDIRDGQLIGVDAGTVRLVSLQPGLRPFANLAEALARTLPGEAATEAALRRGPMGLVQLLDQVKNEPHRALVLVVDQFEEIFRFAALSPQDLERAGDRASQTPMLDGPENEAQAFINLLLATVHQTHHPIYVLLTMRSDFLALCDQFAGLPEMISRSQFLTPRLNRQQWEQAITRPAQLYGATIEPELVNLILNQISTAQDQLPLMQHVLARMWEKRTLAAEGKAVRLTTEDYLAVGGMASALNNHGDSICDVLERSHGIPLENIGAFFRSLADHGATHLALVRRPASVAQIAAETGLSLAAVRTIADAFRAEGCHLLMPPTTRVPELRDETYLDISHESLLRQWTRLRQWMEKEWQMRRMAVELVAAMQEWKTATSDPQKKPLDVFQSWKLAGEALATRLYREAQPMFFGPQAPPNLQPWARRYGIDWAALTVFCKKAFKWKTVTERAAFFGLGAVVVATVLFYAMIFFLWQNHQIKALKESAEKGWQKAKEQQSFAEASEAISRLETRNAQQSYQQALQEKLDAQTNAEAQSRLIRQALATLSDSAGSLPPVRELLQAPELQQLAAVQQTAPAPVEPSGPEKSVQGEGTILEFPIADLLTWKNPSIGFVWRERDVWLVVGADQAPRTLAWNLSSPEVPRQVLPFASPSLAPSPDGQRLLAFGADQQLRSIGAGAKETASGDLGAIISAARVATSQPLRILFGTVDGKVGIWNGDPGENPPLIPTSHRSRVNGLDFTARQNAILASGDQKWARLWQLSPKNAGAATFERVIAADDLPASAAAVQQATFSPDGRFFVLPLASKTAQLYRTANLKQPFPLPHQTSVACAAFSPDGKMLASVDQTGSLYLWDLRHAPEQIPPPQVLLGLAGEPSALLWAPDGSYLLSTGLSGVPVVLQQPLDRLDHTSNDLPLLLPSHPGGITGAALSPDGSRIATVGADGKARVFPLRPTQRGKYRTWGGPAIALGGDGDLALLNRSDVASREFRGLFLPQQPPGTRGLISQLNPDAFYLSARWDYGLTPRSLLRTTKVRLRKLDAAGQPAGPAIEAQPVDWGPAVQTGAAFDLSPGAVRALGLAEGDRVEMQIPLLQPAAQPKTH